MPDVPPVSEKAIPTMTHARRALPLLATTALAGAALAASAPVAGAAPVTTKTPCPTAGTTLAKDVAPTARVYRAGTRLKACVKRPGHKRVVRLLDTWSPDTKVALADGVAAWTTRRLDGEGVASDMVSSEDLRTGRTWLRTAHAAASPAAGTPAADDQVLRIRTSGKATAWVTAGGVVAIGVRRVDPESSTLYGAGVPGTTPYRDGRVFHLRDAGAANAKTVAKGLAFDLGGDGDECGGTTDYQLRVPGWAGQPDLIFVYAREDWTSTSGACS